MRLIAQVLKYTANENDKEMLVREETAVAITFIIIGKIYKNTLVA